MKPNLIMAVIAALALAMPLLAHVHKAAKAGDVSEKWTRKMIEHHRGAVTMSRVALAKASDADTKRMAQLTIDMQEKDIAELQGWLRRHGKPAQ